MTTEEQNAVIVRLMRELTEAKKELAAARERLERLPARIEEIRATLKDAGIEPA